MADTKCIHYGDCGYPHMDCEDDDPFFKCPDRATESRTPSGQAEFDLLCDTEVLPTLLLIYYTAATTQGSLEANCTRTGDSITTADDIEDMREELTKDLMAEGIEMIGSGKVVIANIMNIDKLGV